MTWQLITTRRRGRVLVQHVLPVADAIAHLEAPSCWCQPTQLEDSRLWVHHSADGRERDEPDALPRATLQ